MRTRGIVGIAAVAAALSLAACGSSSSTSSTKPAAQTSGASSSAASADPVVAQADASVTKGYGAGFTEPPPASGPGAVRGKNVWYISCGQSYVSCAEMSKQFQAAGSALGWHVTVQDGKATPSVASSLISEAVAAHVDGVALVGYSCPDLRGGLLTAKKAHVPVVVYSGLDCNAPLYGGHQASLFSAYDNIYGDGTLTKYFTVWGKLRADYIIAKTHGHATVLDVHEITDSSLKVDDRAFKAELARCSGCKVIDVPFNFAQIPSPGIQQIKSAIVAHPEANVISTDVDSLMSLGLAGAIAQSGRHFTLVAGGEGNPTNFQLITEGKQTNSVARADPQHVWGLADTLNRLFAGATRAQLPNEGGGMQIIDAAHNLPPSGQPFLSAINYQAAYKKVWNR